MIVTNPSCVAFDASLHGDICTALRVTAFETSKFWTFQLPAVTELITKAPLTEKNDELVSYPTPLMNTLVSSM